MLEVTPEAPPAPVRQLNNPWPRHTITQGPGSTDSSNPHIGPTALWLRIAWRGLGTPK